jgi:hypothetical protein
LRRVLNGLAFFLRRFSREDTRSTRLYGLYRLALQKAVSVNAGDVFYVKNRILQTCFDSNPQITALEMSFIAADVS